MGAFDGVLVGEIEKNIKEERKKMGGKHALEAFTYGGYYGFPSGPVRSSVTTVITP